MDTSNHGFDNLGTSKLDIESLHKMLNKLEKQRKKNKQTMLMIGIWQNWRNN